MTIAFVRHISKITRTNEQHYVTKLYIFIVILIEMGNKIFQVSGHRVTDVRCNLSNQNVRIHLCTIHFIASNFFIQRIQIFTN